MARKYGRIKTIPHVPDVWDPREWIPIYVDVRPKLIAFAQARRHIAYSELAHLLWGESANRFDAMAVGIIAGDIAAYVETPSGRPILSAILVLKNSITTAYPHGWPSGGFYGQPDLPSKIRRLPGTYDAPVTDEEKKCARAEQEKVWAYWSTHADTYRDP